VTSAARQLRALSGVPPRIGLRQDLGLRAEPFDKTSLSNAGEQLRQIIHADSVTPLHWAAEAP